MAELILALDLPEAPAALSLLDRLPTVGWVKLGSVLFTKAGPNFIADLKARGHRVFLDLKWHDIPNTVKGAVGQARGLGVDMVTVHALGGPSMIEAAKTAAGDQLSVVAVTVLTSHAPAEWAAVLGLGRADLGLEVERLASLAMQAGADGVVSSPLEVAGLRALLGPKALLVTPGVRAAADRKGDQTRTASAGSAAGAGSTHLVVGRPVLESADPALAWATLLEAIR